MVLFALVHITPTNSLRKNEMECVGHGQCDPVTVQCSCDDGFEGIYCQLDQLLCPTGQLDSTGGCCESGVFNSKGECCGEATSDGPWQLDRDGNCCDQDLNACGECGIPGYLDALGNCCRGILDASGICCPSGDVDECGVCDGHGKSCTTQVILSLDAAADYSETCLQDLISSFIFTWNPTMMFSLDAMAKVVQVDISGGSIQTSSFLADLNQTFLNSTLCSVKRVESVVKLPNCGNGICEIGEADGLGYAYHCPKDCPFRYSLCAYKGIDALIGYEDLPCSGKGANMCIIPYSFGVYQGRCLFAQGGMCECLAGYTGDACDQCADGYYLHNNQCHAKQRGKFVPERQKQPELMSRTTNQESSSDKDETTLIMALVIPGACIFVVLVLTLIYIKFLRKTEEIKDDDIVAPPSEPSGSLLTAYIKHFNDFQKSPPWEGILEKHDQQSGT